MMSGTLKLTLAYDGSGFRGSQRQLNGRSVQEDLETALSRLNGREMQVVLAGRTDSGVHAVGQVASVEDARPGLSEERMVRAINAHLPEDLAVLRCERKGSTFHARFDATWREYRYRIWWGSPQPLLRDRVWLRTSALDLDAMATAARALQGTVDLASFAGLGAGIPGAKIRSGKRGTVRTIRHCTVREIDPWWGIAPGAGSGVEIRIVADGFLPHSVRTIASALADIGSGRRSADWMGELIRLADRRHGPQTAPPHGLVLWRVGYGHDVPGPRPNGEHTADEGFIRRTIG
jgi:tRNA pseudouridine38-40 synthase